MKLQVKQDFVNGKDANLREQDVSGDQWDYDEGTHRGSKSGRNERDNTEKGIKGSSCM